MSLEYRVGDVFDRLADIPDGSIDLIVTSPPFLALRSYLPADHPDKGREIGSEATPAAFIDTLLALTAEFGRVLAPHGSICVELGDTFSGSGGGGGDYNVDGWRDGQNRPTGSGLVGRGRKRAELGIEPPPARSRAVDRPQDGGYAYRDRVDDGRGRAGIRNMDNKVQGGGPGWPLAKSLTGIPTLYPWSLAYGRNLLTGQPSPAGLWRIRNIVVWARPNPPVGALGDKFRPATSYITVACRGAKRFFDLDAVRTENGRLDEVRPTMQVHDGRDGRTIKVASPQNPAGAPPLDWHQDLEDGDWLWKLPTSPYPGAHYATYPLELPTRLIRAMCPLRVCVTCGKPSERITGEAEYVPSEHYTGNGNHKPDPVIAGKSAALEQYGSVVRSAPTLGWSDCEHNTWRTGTTLDPFAGSGTTLQAAQNVGRHAIGIDLDHRNGDLARERVGMFLEVTP